MTRLDDAIKKVKAERESKGIGREGDKIKVISFNVEGGVTRLEIKNVFIDTVNTLIDCCELFLKDATNIYSERKIKQDIERDETKYEYYIGSEENFIRIEIERRSKGEWFFNNEITIQTDSNNWFNFDSLFTVNQNNLFNMINKV